MNLALGKPTQHFGTQSKKFKNFGFGKPMLSKQLQSFDNGDKKAHRRQASHQQDSIMSEDLQK